MTRWTTIAVGFLCFLMLGCSSGSGGGGAGSGGSGAGGGGVGGGGVGGGGVGGGGVGGGGVGGGGVGGGGVGGGAADGGCNELVFGSAPLVAETRLAETPPTPTGGALVPGTYFQTTWTQYTTDGGTGPTGRAGKNVLVISGSGTSFTFQRLQQLSTGSVSKFSGEIFTSSKTYTVNVTCGGSSVSWFGYTATAGQFTSFTGPFTGPNELTEYVKQ